MRTLIDHLAGLESGVVSISGFATAVPEESLGEFLRILNFNRESLSDFPLRQIWWLTGDFLDAFLRVAPDLNSWFLARLQISEEVQPPDRDEEHRLEVAQDDSPDISPEDALRWVSALIARIRAAVASGASPADILRLAGSAAKVINHLRLPEWTKEASEELGAIGASDHRKTRNRGVFRSLDV